MAKVKLLTYKVVVDGQEVEQSIVSIDGYQQRINELYKQLNATPINSKKFQELQGEIKRTEGAFENVKNANKSWLEVAAGAPGIVGTLGQSLQGVGKLFGSLNMAFKTSVIGLFATVIAKLVEKFSQMEGVLDPLNKITAIFSGTIGKLANVILPPISATLEAIASGAEKVVNFFSQLAGGSDSLGDDLGRLEEQQDALNDSQAEYELGLAKANRALNEAREIAGDSTKPIGERKKALQDAAKIEDEIAEKGKQRALAQARITAEQIAQSLNLSQEEIKNLRNADAQYLESFATRIAAQKGLNQEQRTALLQQLGQAEEIAAGQAKIGKKTNAQLKALDNEAVNNAKAAAKEKRDARKAELDAEIKLLTQFADDTQNKDQAYYDKLKAQLKKFYDEKNALEDKDRKLTKAERDARAKEQAKSINDAVAGVKNAADKQKLLDEQLKQSADEVAKAKQKQTTDIVEQIKIQQVELDKAYEKENARLEAAIIFAEKTYGKDSEKYKEAQIAKNKADAAYFVKKQENDTKIVEAEQTKSEKVKSIDDVLNQQLNSAQKNNLDKQLKEIQKSGDDKIAAYKKQLDDAVKVGALTAEEAATRLKQFTGSVTASIKEQTQAAIGQDFLDSVKAGLDSALSAGTESFSATSAAVKKSQDQLDEAYKNGKITQAQYTAATIENEKKMLTARERNRAAIDAAANAVGNLAAAFGEESSAGKALIKVQQALALTSTAMALADSIAGLGKDIKKGFPTNVIAVASTLALIGTAFAQAKALFSKAKGAEQETASAEPRKLADGGIVSGTGTSTSDSIPAMLSNGESVINAQSTAMFTPLLSAINQAGGGVPFQFGGSIGGTQAGTASADMVPIKTYVVASDMTSMQQFEMAQKSRSTI